MSLYNWAEGVGCVDSILSSNSAFINMVGLPIHLSCYDLEKVGDFCGGFIDVACSMHDLTRVRILVKKGCKVPISVVVDDGVMEFRIWCF